MGAWTRPASVLATRTARELAAELGLLDRSVFFNDTWVPYEERAAWLLDADCALSCHTQHLETRFALRTRSLDCFWASLPIVCTAGDALAERVQREDLGGVVPERDPAAVAAALERVLARGKPSYAGALERVASAHRWPVVAEPLVRYVLDPAPAPGTGRRAVRRPSHQARTSAYYGARGVLNRVGVRGWPRI
jgi:glycosyltransferase involved in cell wall biosynthesis